VALLIPFSTISHLILVADAGYSHRHVYGVKLAEAWV
jgi:hypothetical protein